MLDRAFTIEFNAVDLQDYPPSPGAIEGKDEGAQLDREAYWREQFLGGVTVGKVAVADAADRWPGVMPCLRRLKDALAAHDFHFGYRVVDEILAFVANATQTEELHDWTAAFDQAMVMKVLPKVHGPRSRAAKALEALIAFGTGALEAGTPGAPSPPFPGLVAKAKRMRAVAEAEGYVRFA